MKTTALEICDIFHKGINTPALTVTAERPRVGGHGAVAGEALPQLQTHSLVVAGVLCAGGAGTCRVETAALPGAFLLYFNSCIFTTFQKGMLMLNPSQSLLHSMCKDVFIF